MMTIVRTTEGAQGSEPEVATVLDELAREGARRMILAALEVEVEAYRQQHREARDRRGHALVVRNGPGRPRRLTVGSGTVMIRAPRVHDQRVVDGVRQKFTSQILPPYVVPEGQCGPATALPAWFVQWGFPASLAACSWGRTWQDYRPRRLPA